MENEELKEYAIASFEADGYAEPFTLGQFKELFSKEYSEGARDISDINASMLWMDGFSKLMMHCRNGLFLKVPDTKKPLGQKLLRSTILSTAMSDMVEKIDLSGYSLYIFRYGASTAITKFMEKLGYTDL